MYVCLKICDPKLLEYVTTIYKKKIKNKKYGNKVKDLVGAPIDGYTRNCHGLKAVTIC